MNKILMHACCGPCSIFPLEELKKEFDVTGLFFNPNIQPYTEYEQRLNTAREHFERMETKLIVIDEYNLQEFVRNTAFRENQRCIYCYSVRLERAASVAKNGNFQGFTTSMLVSPKQNHELIRSLGEAAGKKYRVEFIYRDFRPGYKEATEKSRELEMYRQQYCGCIYSEMERYMPRKGRK